MTLEQLTEHVVSEFKARHGRDPQWIAAAPGRVNVIGEHTDYNDGFVFPMAIERYTLMAGAPGQGTTVNLQDVKGNAQASVEVSQIPQPAPKGSWHNYPMGVIAGFMQRGVRIPGMDVVFETTVPIGGGLSSSAALEVSTATLLEAATGHRLDPVDKALLCQQAEHKYAGMPCGIMDQFISVMGRKDHILLLDCRSRETTLVPMTDPSVALLITNTNVKHELTGGEYAQRRAQCEEAAKILGVPSLREATAEKVEQFRGKMSDVVYRRAKHVISEIERTTHAAEGVRASNWATVGQLMYASHYSLKNDYEVSCPELDAVVAIAEEIGSKGGVYGCRMTGGGFGGCTVALVKASAVDSVSERIASEYEKRTRIKPTLFVSRPAAGATLIKG